MRLQIGQKWRSIITGNEWKVIDVARGKSRTIVWALSDKGVYVKLPSYIFRKQRELIDERF